MVVKKNLIQVLISTNKVVELFQMCVLISKQNIALRKKEFIFLDSFSYFLLFINIHILLLFFITLKGIHPRG